MQERGASGAYQLLICRVASKVCGLPLADVVETMRPLPLERLANMPRYVQGLSVIRGRPTPVLDGRVLLGSGTEPSPDARYVTLALGARQIALLVDAVLGIRSVLQAELQQLPALLRQAQAEQVEAVGTLDAELLLILEHARLLTDTHFAAIEAGS
jgi:purine-binding chemotaxis protein CheW